MTFIPGQYAQTIATQYKRCNVFSALRCVREKRPMLPTELVRESKRRLCRAYSTHMVRVSYHSRGSCTIETLEQGWHAFAAEGKCSCAVLRQVFFPRRTALPVCNGCGPAGHGT